MSVVHSALFVEIVARWVVALNAVVDRFAWSHAPLVLSRKIDGMEVEIPARGWAGPVVATGGSKRTSTFWAGRLATADTFFSSPGQRAGGESRRNQRRAQGW